MRLWTCLARIGMLISVSALVACGGGGGGASNTTGDTIKANFRTLFAQNMADIQAGTLPDGAVPGDIHVLRELLDQEGLGDTLTPEAVSAILNVEAGSFSAILPNGSSAVKLTAKQPFSRGVGDIILQPIMMDMGVGIELGYMFNQLHSSDALPDAQFGSSETPIQEFDAGTTHFSIRQIHEVDIGYLPGGQIMGTITTSQIYTVTPAGGQPHVETIKTVVTIDGKACPDANGTATIYVESETFGTNTISQSNLGRSAKVTAHVGDDAWLKNATIDFNVWHGNRNSPTVELGGTWLLTSSLSQVGSTTHSTYHLADSSSDISYIKGGESDLADYNNNKTFYTDAFSLALFYMSLEDVLSAAEDNWRNNGCVIIKVPEGNDHTVGPNSKNTFTANVLHKWEETQLPVPVTVAFSGESSVDPTRIDSAPGVFTVTAGSAWHDVADCDLESVSKRGRATTNVHYIVNPSYSGWLYSNNTLFANGGGTVQKMSANLDQVTWSMSDTPAPAPFANELLYNTSTKGYVQLQISGPDWEATCDPVNYSYPNQVEFTGNLMVFNAARTDSYAAKYYWNIVPSNPLFIYVPAYCDTDGDPTTPRVLQQRPIALNAPITSSCGFSQPPYDPLGYPDDMPQYRDIATLENLAGNTWACINSFSSSEIDNSEEWSFKANSNP